MSPETLEYRGGDVGSRSATRVTESPRSRRWLWYLGALLTLAVMVAALVLLIHRAQMQQQQAASRASAIAKMPTMVVVSRARQVDVKEYLAHCLGAVTPFSTVTLKTRVETL